MSLLVSNVLFTCLVLLTAVPAVMVVITQHIVRAACWLLLSLAGAAGLFFFLGADFVGATQLLIYVGGTLVLVIFGVMLTATGPFVNLRASSGDWAMSVLVGFSLLAIVTFGIAQPTWFNPAMFEDSGPTRASTNRIGMAFLGFPEENPTPAHPAEKEDVLVDPPKHVGVGYLLPFEVISVHLVLVLVGAAYLARAKQRPKRETA
ncbi:NADH:ubiquinone oxidoreductase subunit J [Planctomycetes bacterium Pan216]|uniref:NADH-quinone oxidoreductase subunit J n=1 Tax=Kolteria novifilia TaxID=2527975 RepID=A0A518B185_9BACT|nr:NADH:ubiquinone oxidoreductase subunit J [Planctomycetes bacterium Pan216]